MSHALKIGKIKHFYTGFTIDKAIGNNAFSFQHRTNRQIYVPPLIAGDIGKLKVGQRIVFSEIFEGKEFNKRGLENFIYWQKRDQHIFIFDNHNHAFFFWMAAKQAGILSSALPLVHIDQHTDMREPERYFVLQNGNIDLQKAFEYTNFTLNVGNFIQPALKMGLFTNVEIIDNSTAFEKKIDSEIVLDIDIDIFSEEMAYIDEKYKLERIKNYLEKAKLVTVASSPYFIDQQLAIEWIKKILG